MVNWTEITKNLTENATTVSKLNATMWINFTKMLPLVFYESSMLPWIIFF